MRQMILEDAGYSVASALNVDSALQAMRHNLFVLAVVDGSQSPEQDVRQLLVTLHSFAVPSLLIAPRDIAADLKSLTNAYIPCDDAFLLTEMVKALVPKPSESSIT